MSQFVFSEKILYDNIDYEQMKCFYMFCKCWQIVGKIFIIFTVDWSQIQKPVTLFLLYKRNSQKRYLKYLKWNKI